MGIFKEICETRVVGSRLQYLGMKQRLQQAISRRVAHAFDLVFHSRFETVGARSCVFFAGAGTGATERMGHLPKPSHVR
jgi:hypothetical protein